MSFTAEQFRKRFNWQKVHAPKTWRPLAGEELAGYYGGRTVKNGIYGQYEVVIVHVPQLGSFLLSGTELIQLLDAAGISKGHPVRIVFKGKEKSKTDDTKEIKRFDLLVADLEEITADTLPEVTT